tara:strand:- start:8812 stop:9105 length:294 start_codon:yes stop_codon:yes gene_type:complete
MISIWKLKKQVNAASLANRKHRHDLAHRRHLLSRSIAASATQPIVLGSATLIGFCIGIQQNHHQSTATGKDCIVVEKILPLVVSYLFNTAYRESGAP